jgi:hypothetical protein
MLNEIVGCATLSTDKKKNFFPSQLISVMGTFAKPGAVNQNTVTVL